MMMTNARIPRSWIESELFLEERKLAAVLETKNKSGQMKIVLGTLIYTTTYEEFSRGFDDKFIASIRHKIDDLKSKLDEYKG